MIGEGSTIFSLFKSSLPLYMHLCSLFGGVGGLAFEIFAPFLCIPFTR